MERVKRELENGRECSLLKPGERIFFSQLKESDTCKSAKTGTAEHTHRSPVSRAASFNLFQIIFSTDDLFRRGIFVGLSSPHLPQQWSCFR